MEETKIEKLEETKLEEPAENVELKKALERISKLEENLAEKKTQAKPSNTNEDKEIKLHRQYRHLSDDAIKHLVQLKDNRKFEITEDGISVKEVEEKW